MPASRPFQRRGSLLVPLSLVAVAGTVSHFGFMDDPLSRAGPVLVLDHVFAVLAVAALWAVASGVGRFVVRSLRYDPGSGLDRFLVASAVGFGAVATAILALGALGLLDAPLLWGGLAVVAIAVRRDRSRTARQPVTGPFPDPGARSESLLGGAVFLVVGLSLLALALAPPSDWDSLMYHLRIPAQYATEGRVFLPEDNLHATLIGLAHVLYVPLLSIGVESGPALLSSTFAAALGLAVFAACDRAGDRSSAWLALALLWGTTTIVLVAITPRVDVTVAFFLFVATTALPGLPDRSGSHTGGAVSSGGLAVVGALLGFAVGVKPQALLYVAALAPVLAWVIVRERGWGAATFGGLAVLGSALVVAAAPWLLKNVWLAGSPFYPGTIGPPRLEPWLASLYGSTVFPGTVDLDLTRWIWELRRPFNLPDFFLHPGRLAIEGEATRYYANPFLLLSPLGLLAFRRRIAWGLGVPGILYVVALIAIFPRTNLRYLIPGLVPLTIVALVGAATLSRRWKPRMAARMLLVLVALALWPTMDTLADRGFRTPALAHAVGIRSGLEYLRRHDDLAVRQYASALPELRAVLGPDSRTLMLFEARGYHLPGDIVQDNTGTNWPLLARAPGFDGSRCLRDVGFTHVLVNQGAVAYYRASGLDPARFAWPAFLAFAAECLDVVYERFGFVLFRTRPTVAGRAPAKAITAGGPARGTDLRAEGGRAAVPAAATP